MFDSMQDISHSLVENSNISRNGNRSSAYNYAKRNWHAGCNVVKGTKVILQFNPLRLELHLDYFQVILQKFKELPMRMRNDKSTDPPNHPYNPYLLEQ